jgi:hypothetical protein
LGLILVAHRVSPVLDSKEQLQELKRPSKNRRPGKNREAGLGDARTGDLSFAPGEQGKIKMSFSEKLVDGLAVSILFLGFVTGVIAKPMNKSPHETTPAAHSLMVHAQQNQDARRAVFHS